MNDFYKKFQSELDEHLLIFDIQKNSPFNAYLIIIKSYIHTITGCLKGDPRNKILIETQQKIVDKLISLHSEHLSKDNLSEIHHFQRLLHTMSKEILDNSK